MAKAFVLSWNHYKYHYAATEFYQISQKKTGIADIIQSAYTGFRNLEWTLHKIITYVT